jgi:hypothetical protein
MPLPFSLSDALAASALTTGTLSALAYLLFPRLKEMVWRWLEADLPRFDRLRKKAIDGDPQYAEAFVKNVLQKELVVLRKIEEQARAHDDTLEFLQAAIMEQTREMKQLPSIAAALQQNAKAFEAISATLKDIHSEISDHSKQLAKWDGFMAGMEGKWSGIERRGKGRRHEDSDDS